MDFDTIMRLWTAAGSALRAQLGQRTPAAVFLEGSIAEGFGNDRSDVDFVVLVDDGTEVATMPYIVFAEERRIEVRLLNLERIVRELDQIKAALASDAGALSTRVSWNTLERCQRFMGCLPLQNETLIKKLQDRLGRDNLRDAVAGWFEDFAMQAGRYAIAMQTFAQHTVAHAWMKTAVFHAAKSMVARHGECYLGSKWLSLQLERASIDVGLRQRFWDLMREPLDPEGTSEYLQRGTSMLESMQVSGVVLDEHKVTLGQQPRVSTWQIGQRIHVLRDDDVFALGQGAARAWRAIRWATPCVDLLEGEALGAANPVFAQLARLGLVVLCWENGEPIRIGQQDERHVAALGAGPFITFDGAQVEGLGDNDICLLPTPATRFAQAGVNLFWANIGVENALEDSLGAYAKQQWQVLEYTNGRMLQAAALVALAAWGVTPQPPLEEAIATARRLLPLPPDVVAGIGKLESQPIENADEGAKCLADARFLVSSFRALAGAQSEERPFPASFDDDGGWAETVLCSYDWINLAAHLDAPFPASAAGGRGTAEEARDLLASNLS